MAMTYGTKVRTLYQHSWTGTIVRPRKSEQTRPDWFIVKDDETGGKLCIHRSMLVERNS